jgi:hypothetical protein
METVEIGQIIAQLKMTENMRIITQDLNGNNVKVLVWEVFTVEEQSQLNACVEMIKNK